VYICQKSGQVYEGFYHRLIANSFNSKSSKTFNSIISDKSRYPSGRTETKNATESKTARWEYIANEEQPAHVGLMRAVQVNVTYTGTKMGNKCVVNGDHHFVLRVSDV
jgi:hypothetical protein